MRIKKASLMFAMSISLIIPASVIPAVAAKTTLVIDSWRTDDSKIWNEILIPMYEKANPNVDLV